MNPILSSVICFLYLARSNTKDDAVTPEGFFRYIPGPTLIDLSSRIKESLLVMPFIFSSRSIGYVVGIVVGYFLFQYMMFSNQKNLVMFLAFFLLSATLFSISVYMTFSALLVAFCASGFCMGVIDSGIHAVCFHVGIHQTTTFFLVLQLFYGIGALMAPVMSRNYVAHKLDNTSFEVEYIPGDNNTASKTFGYMTKISYLYMNLGAVIFIVGLFWLAHYFAPFQSLDITDDRLEVDDNKLVMHMFRKLSIVNTCILTFLAESLAFSYLQALPVFYEVHYETDIIKAMDFTTMMLSFFCMGRLIVTVFPHMTCALHFLSLFAIMFGSIILFLHTAVPVSDFWIANGLVGLGAGFLYPTLYFWLGTKFFITPKRLNPMLIMGSLSEMTVPYFLSQTIWVSFTGKSSLNYYIIGMASIYLAFLIGQYALLYLAYKKKHESEDVPLPDVPLSLVRRISTLISGKQDRQNCANQNQQSNEPDDPTSIYRGISNLKSRIRQNNETVKSALKQLEYGSESIKN